MEVWRILILCSCFCLSICQVPHHNHHGHTTSDREIVTTNPLSPKQPDIYDDYDYDDYDSKPENIISPHDQHNGLDVYPDSLMPIDRFQSTTAAPSGHNHHHHHHHHDHNVNSVSDEGMYDYDGMTGIPDTDYTVTPYYEITTSTPQLPKIHDEVEIWKCQNVEYHIPLKNRCDGEIDCPDTSDETHCTRDEENEHLKSFAQSHILRNPLVYVMLAAIIIVL